MQNFRIEQITFTRFIAAMAIVIFHFGNEVIPFNLEPLRTIILSADVGVSYFFILSGFIMIVVYFKRENILPIAYYQSRFARIYPVYFLAIILCHLAILLKLLSFDLSGLILNIFMVQAWIPGKALTVNSPAWSLSVEVLFYSLFPFLLLVYKKISLGLSLTIGLFLFLISQVITNWLVSSTFYQGYPSPSHDAIFYYPLMHLNEFITGNITGLFFIRYFEGRFRKNGALIFLVGIIMLVVLYMSLGLEKHNGLLAIVFVPLIILISTDNGILSVLFSQPLFIFLGEISYGIYILQVPIFFLSKKLLALLGVTGPIRVFYFYVLILITAASLIYIFIEKPLRKWINGFQLLSPNSSQTH